MYNVQIFFNKMYKFNKLSMYIKKIFYIYTHLAVADLANCTIIGLSFKI